MIIFASLGKILKVFTELFERDLAVAVL